MRDWPFHQNRQHLYKWTICLRALYYTYQIRHKFSGGFAPYYPFQSVGTHDIDQIRSPRGSKLTKAAMQSEEYEWACDFSTPSPAAPPLHTILSNHAWGRWSILTSSSFLTEDVSHPMKRSIPQREHRGREDHKDRPTEWSNLWVLSLRWAGPPQGHPLSISHVRPHFPLTTQTLFSKAWDMALGFRKLLRHCVQLEKITQPHVRATVLLSSSLSPGISMLYRMPSLFVMPLSHPIPFWKAPKFEPLSWYPLSHIFLFTLSQSKFPFLDEIKACRKQEGEEPQCWTGLRDPVVLATFFCSSLLGHSAQTTAQPWQVRNTSLHLTPFSVTRGCDKTLTLVTRETEA